MDGKRKGGGGREGGRECSKEKDSFFLCVCPSIYLLINSSVCMSSSLLIGLSVCKSASAPALVCLLVYLSFCLPVGASIYVRVCVIVASACVLLVACFCVHAHGSVWLRLSVCVCATECVLRASVRACVGVVG